jgi:hypothetical protein
MSFEETKTLAVDAVPELDFERDVCGISTGEDAKVEAAEVKPGKKRAKRKKAKQDTAKPVSGEEKSEPEAKADDAAKAPGPSKTNPFPAIKQVKFPENKDEKEDWFGGVVKYYIPKSNEHTDETVKILSKYHPSVTLNYLKDPGTYNRHPLCAAFRSIGEAFIITCLFRELRSADIVCGKISDIGGSVNRHHSLGRKYIHSCVPNFEVKDLTRSFALKGVRYCRHRWEECDCHPFVASMSVHSLYYVQPRDLLVGLLKQKLPIHYALLHRYNKRKGTIMHGEMEYTREDGIVNARAKGNMQWYTHGDMAWLDEEGYVCEEGTLAWEMEREFEDVVVIRFVASREIVALKEKPEPTVVVEEKCEEKVVDLDKQIKEIIMQCYKSSEEFTPKAYKSYLERIRRKVLAARDKGHDLDVIEVTRTASRYYETIMPDLFRVNDRFVAKAAEHKSRLNLQLQNRTYWVEVFLWFAVIASWFDWRLALLDLLVFHSFSFYLRVNSMEMLTLMRITAYMFMPQGKIPAVVELFWLISKTHGLARLEARGPILPLSMLKLMDYCCGGPTEKLDSYKTIKYVPPSGYDEAVCEPGVRAYPMVYHPDHLPCIPRRCAHNVHTCVVDKVLVERKCDPTVWKELELPEYFYAIAEEMDFDPLSFEEWVSRFPAKKQVRLRREYADQYDEYIPADKVNESSLFMKSEFYPKPKPPRPIIASNVRLNFSVGRWLIPLLEVLSSELIHYGVCFPLHAESVEIGRFMEEHREGARLADCDFSRFDSTQNEECLEILIRAFQLFGLPKHIADLMRLDKDHIFVSLPKDGYYVCRALRCSGRSETLGGNSLLTLILASYAAGDKLRNLLVKGDDSVFFFDDCVDEAYLDGVKRKFDRLGLISKLKYVDFDNVEFCSSYFIPSSVGLVLTPKPGKMLAKTFFCKNTDYSPDEVQRQYVGILKGLSHNLRWLPGLRGAYSHWLYYRHFLMVDAHREEYNEYTDVEGIECTDETYQWFDRVYGLSHEHLDDLETNLQTGFPIKLDCDAADYMIEKDWGSEIHIDNHLVETDSQPTEGIRRLVVGVILEEGLRWCQPWFFSLLFGLIESYCYQSFVNLVLHVLLGWLMLEAGPLACLVLHLAHNYRAAGGNSLSLCALMAKRSARRKAPRRKRGNKTNGNGMIAKYASMVSDPCNSTLVSGFYGSAEGFVQRFKTTFTIDDTSGGHGMVLWDPFLATVSDGTHGNAFAYSDNAASDSPTNSVAAPLGTTNYYDNSGEFLQVAAGAFIDSTSCSQFRVISACMRMTYTGPVLSAAGMLAYLEEIPAELLIEGDGTNAISTSEAFVLASKTERFGIETREITSRPSERSRIWKTDRESPFTVGTAGTSATYASNEALRMGSTLSGFAWTGIDTTSSPLQIEFIQVVEWKPKATLGFVQPIPKQITPPGFYETVLGYLDSKYPGWTTTLGRVASHAGAKIANAAFTGVDRYLAGPNQPLRVGWR